MNQPPIPQQGKTSGLAITSLVLGILSLCCGFFLGIPAIITGVIARKKIRFSLMTGDGMALAGIILGCFSFVVTILYIVISIPGFAGAFENVGLMSNLRHAAKVTTAMQDAARDTTDGQFNFALPADMGATNAREYIQLLVPKYITQEDADLLLENFMVGNVSHSDPTTTILFRSKGPESPVLKRFVVFRVDGTGNVLPVFRADEAGKEPPREPAYLAD